MARTIVLYEATLHVEVETDESPGGYDHLKPGCVVGVDVEIGDLIVNQKASKKAIEIAETDIWESPEWR
jgi:hypothetical protein